MGASGVYVVFSLLCCGILFALAVVAGLIFVFDDYHPRYKVDVINERSELAEGPYWDEGHQRLYWVDMRKMLINSYSPDSGNIFKAKVVSDKAPVTLVVRVQDTDDKFVVALKGFLALVQWDGISNVDVIPVHLMDVVEDPTSGSRCNDGKVDPSNRLWVGTMGAQTESNPKGNKFEKDKGEVYRIDFDGNNGKKIKMVERMQIPNGLEWSLDKKSFYLVDSLTFVVTEYLYNDEKGTIEESKEIYDLKKHGLVGTEDKPNSLPDGMTIDKEGWLWIAVYGTGKVIRINPKNGKKEFQIQLHKVLQPTSVCFGGKNLDMLFVTSAHVDWTQEHEKKYADSGKLFKITNLEVSGAGPSRPVKLPKALLEKAFKKNVQSATTTNQSNVP